MLKLEFVPFEMTNENERLLLARYLVEDRSEKNVLFDENREASLTSVMKTLSKHLKLNVLS